MFESVLTPCDFLDKSLQSFLAKFQKDCLLPRAERDYLSENHLAGLVAKTGLELKSSGV